MSIYKQTSFNITKIEAYEVLDSRGFPTVAAKV